MVEAATATATARHFFDVCVAEGCLGPLELLCQRARSACLGRARAAFDLEVVLVDYEGAGVVRAPGPKAPESFADPTPPRSVLKF